MTHRSRPTAAYRTHSPPTSHTRGPCSPSPHRKEGKRTGWWRGDSWQHHPHQCVRRRHRPCRAAVVGLLPRQILLLLLLLSPHLLQ